MPRCIHLHHTGLTFYELSIQYLFGQSLRPLEMLHELN